MDFPMETIAAKARALTVMETVRSVVEETKTRESHRHVVLIGSSDHFRIGHTAASRHLRTQRRARSAERETGHSRRAHHERAAYHEGDAARGGHVERIAEGEEGIRSESDTVERLEESLRRV